MRIYPSFCTRVTGLMIAAMLCLAPYAVSQDNDTETPPDKPARLALAEAIMCETLKDYTPQNTGIAFSISVGEVSCFTMFDPVPEKAIIYHRWYHRDNASTRKRLTLKPPRWATFSTIQLRQTDIGPWRVEIVDHKDRVLKILRFSVTE